MSQDDTAFTATVGDLIAEKDRLGFEPYVEAVAHFLRSPGTKPPLTMSIEGEWGSGKSSFMAQLQSVLKEGVTELPGVESRRPFMITFNAWRHDKEDALWAAFALSFSRQIALQLPFWERLVGSIKLLISRFNWRDGWLEASRAVAISTLLILLALILPVTLLTQGRAYANSLSSFIVSLGHKSGDPKNEDSTHKTDDPIVALLLTGTGWTSSIALAIYLWTKARKVIGNPLEVNLRKYQSSPDYESRTEFIESFHRDFKRIVNAYTDLNHQKVYVFVDDLDRCEPSKAADLMRAINMLIAEDQRLIFIIGMDRQKIAAGIALKYENLLPYLIRGNSQNGNGAQSVTRDLRFGNEFLEKFIQLPFSVPAPSPECLRAFVQDISETTKSTEEVQPRPGQDQSEESQDAKRVEAGVGKDEASRQRDGTNPIKHSERDSFRLLVERDFRTVRDITLLVSDALRDNPRRIKQFINLFRLKFYIAIETGLFDTIDGQRELEPEQLGKLTAIFLRWPSFAYDWLENPELLKRLQDFALSPRAATETIPWIGNKEFLDLLSVGCDEKTPNPTKYRLDNLKVDKILRILPRRPESGDLSGGFPISSQPDLSLARNELNRLAKSYELVRKGTPASDKRTIEMNKLVAQMQRFASEAGLTAPELKNAFNRNSDGYRIVVLALLRKKPDSQCLDVILEGIKTSRSAFEQFHSLRAAEAVVPSLSTKDSSLLAEAIMSQMNQTITTNDTSRWELAQILLNTLALKEPAEPASETDVPTSVPSKRDLKSRPA
jgi:KAP family P-loop domain